MLRIFMRIVKNRKLVEMDVKDPTTGEFFKAQGSNEETIEYYSISKITSRINAMDLFTIMENTCKSSKDIYMMNELTELVDNCNQIRIDNISNLAKDLNVSRSKLNAFLKKLIDNNFLQKLNIGIYFVNPYIFVGRRVRSNKLREEAQRAWDIKDPTDDIK